MDTLGTLLDEISHTLPADRSQLRRLKIRHAGASGGLVRNDALLARYREDVGHGRRTADARLERVLRLNDIRSQSGVATVTVITKPFACPGRCVYCPTEQAAPKSYLTNEPAVRRALRHGYDPGHQLWGRLDALRQTGHATDKIELIIKGGTWSFYPEAYQRGFVAGCAEAATRYAEGSAPPGTGSGDAEVSWESLDDVLARNETGAGRLVGITVETRPDYVDDTEIRRLRRLGVTRVELGVQTLEEPVLERVVRDHDTAEIRRATRLLKDAGFKVAYHIMPNLPGATPKSDLLHFRRLFEGTDYQPDTLKLYPCVVIESAELHAWWRQGRYAPYDDETLTALLAEMKRLVPPTVRIERIIRDIPSPSIRGGCKVTNLREAVQRRMRRQGWQCRCIRCRQVRDRAPDDVGLVTRTYEASGAVEHFLSFEDPSAGRLAALLRLRIPGPGSDALFPELTAAALIREVHAYGEHLALAKRRDDAVQHQGLGSRLVAAAEDIARREPGIERMAVIAGVGVRAYYRRLGYRLEGTYMVKNLR